MQSLRFRFHSLRFNLKKEEKKANVYFLNQQTMGSNCARTTDVTHDIECRPTTTETRITYDQTLTPVGQTTADRTNTHHYIELNLM